MDSLEKYRKKRMENQITILMSRKAIDFFQNHMDIVRGPFIRDAIDEKIDRIEKEEIADANQQ